MHLKQTLRSAWRVGWLGALLGMALTLTPLAPLGKVAAGTQALPKLSSNVTVFATGLDNPRGLKFGTDGTLYVAEGGRGGSNTTVGKCTQVPSPTGPYKGGLTARISKVSPTGVRATLVDHLPSDQVTPTLGSSVAGVADVALIGQTLYALLAGGGCSHGNPTVPASIIRVDPNGSYHVIANLGAYLKTHPVKRTEPANFEPDGSWYSMITVGGNLYAVEANHGELDKITPGGAISRVIDISASQGHAVPTAVAFHNNFYVSSLLTPNLYKVTPGGQISIATRGVQQVLGVAFDQQGNLYALENSNAYGSPRPFTGQVVRVTKSGNLETIASGLAFPTAMTFGPDGLLYVSNFGYGFPPGKGQIVRIKVPPVSGTGGGPPQGHSVKVSIIGQDHLPGFSPDTITVKSGQTITWTNVTTEGIAHTVTADNGGFDSTVDKPIEQGKSYSHTFTASGKFPYHCSFHPQMTGTVIVVRGT